MYRIFQESLTNAWKRAWAEQVVAILKIWSDRVHLEIIDNDVGFEATAYFGPYVERHQLGLVGMQQRARDAGGAFEVESTPGRGTRVLVEILLS